MTLPESDRGAEQNLEIIRANAASSLSERDAAFAESLLQQLDRTQALSLKQWFWVDQLASRCIKVIADYGHQTGRCQFCRRKLTDLKSVKYGYGPVCAHRNHLPYG